MKSVIKRIKKILKRRIPLQM